VIRLYRALFSTNVERVAIALAHKGLEAESIVIDYDDRSVVQRVSGQGLVPVIDYDGAIVVDSMQILLFLEQRHPDPPLYPAGAARRAEMLVFIDSLRGDAREPRVPDGRLPLGRGLRGVSVPEVRGRSRRGR
jgi:glutathione S-transferase